MNDWSGGGSPKLLGQTQNSSHPTERPIDQRTTWLNGSLWFSGILSWLLLKVVLTLKNWMVWSSMMVKVAVDYAPVQISDCPWIFHVNYSTYSKIKGSIHFLKQLSHANPFKSRMSPVSPYLPEDVPVLQMTLPGFFQGPEDFPKMVPSFSGTVAMSRSAIFTPEASQARPSSTSQRSALGMTKMWLKQCKCKCIVITIRSMLT